MAINIQSIEVGSDGYFNPVAVLDEIGSGVRVVNQLLVEIDEPQEISFNMDLIDELQFSITELE